MGNPFFNVFGGGNTNNPLQLLAQLKSNPMAFFQRSGYNIPSDLNNPQAIIQHLMNSGQITQQQMEQAKQMASRFGVR